MQRGQKQTGFTIVELLIVIVVIAILAAITIVAYNGIQNRAKETAVKNDVAQAVRQVEAAKAGDSKELYPASSAITLKSSGGVTARYSPNSTGNEYCVQATNGTLEYMATSLDKTVRTGTCDVDSGLVVWLRMNGNATNTGSAGGTFSVTGATATTGQNGQANTAYQFTSGSTISQTITNEFPQLTASAWVYNDSLSGTPGLLNGIAASPIHWEISGGAWRLRLAGIDRGNIATPSPAQTWSHVLFTYDRTSGALRYYLNGSLVTTLNGNSGLNDYFSGGFVIGQSNGAGRQWLGKIDDVRAYNRVLSDAEVQTLYAAGAQ
jgi:prepilin-type N-terminal cleavage/methylation domain-containing protein